MNGAIAELWARTINAPSRNSTTIIGTSHQRLLLTRNENSSPATPRFRVVFRKNFMGSPSEGTLAVLYEVDARSGRTGTTPPDSAGSLRSGATVLWVRKG